MVLIVGPSTLIELTVRPCRPGRPCLRASAPAGVAAEEAWRSFWALVVADGFEAGQSLVRSHSCDCRPRGNVSVEGTVQAWTGLAVVELIREQGIRTHCTNSGSVETR